MAFRNYLECSTCGPTQLRICFCCDRTWQRRAYGFYITRSGKHCYCPLCVVNWKASVELLGVMQKHEDAIRDRRVCWRCSENSVKFLGTIRQCSVATALPLQLQARPLCNQVLLDYDGEELDATGRWQEKGYLSVFNYAMVEILSDVHPSHAGNKYSSGYRFVKFAGQTGWIPHGILHGKSFPKPLPPPGPPAS